MANHHVVILDCAQGCFTSIRIEAGQVDIASDGRTNVGCNWCGVPMIVRLATMPSVQTSESNPRTFPGLIRVEPRGVELQAFYEAVVALYEDWHNRAPAHEGAHELGCLLRATAKYPPGAIIPHEYDGPPSPTPPDEPERFWKTTAFQGEEGWWTAVYCDASGEIAGFIGAWPTRDEAVAGGRASGVREWTNPRFPTDPENGCGPGGWREP